MSVRSDTWTAAAAALLAAAMIAGCSSKDGDSNNAATKKDSPSYLEVVIDAKLNAERQACRAQLRSLVVAMEVHRMAEGRYPSSLDELVGGGHLLRCPAPGGKPYEYVDGHGAPSGGVLVYEAQAAHQDKCHVLRADGTVDLLTPEQVAAAVAETKRNISGGS